MNNDQNAVYEGPSTRWLCDHDKWYYSSKKLSDDAQREYWTPFYLRQPKDRPKVLPLRANHGNFLNARKEPKLIDQFSGVKRR